MGGEPEPLGLCEARSLAAGAGGLQASLAALVTKTCPSTQQPPGTSVGPFNPVHKLLAGWAGDWVSSPLCHSHLCDGAAT